MDQGTGNNPYNLTEGQLTAIRLWEENKGAMWSGDNTTNVANLFVRANELKKTDLAAGQASEKTVFAYLERRNQPTPVTI
jgi:hypothetical protein